MCGQLTVIDYSDTTPDVSYTHDRLGRLSTVTDAAGFRTLTYNAVLQPDAEVINGSGSGLYNKVILRIYQASGTSGLPPGRYTGFTVGPDVTNPAADYTAGCEYDAVSGRFSGITGTALPAGGVQYGYLAASDLIDLLEYKADASTVLATTTRGYEPGRDVLTSVENRWGASVISKYDYVSDSLGRRSSVVYSGSAFAGGAGDHFDLYGYNDRNELTGSTGYFGPVKVSG